MATRRDKSNLAAQARNYCDDAILFLKPVMYGQARFVDKAGQTHAMPDDIPLTERVKAANALLDRGYGKPAQALAFGADDDGGTRRVRFTLTIGDKVDDDGDGGEEAAD